MTASAARGRGRRRQSRAWHLDAFEVVGRGARNSPVVNLGDGSTQQRDLAGRQTAVLDPRADVPEDDTVVPAVCPYKLVFADVVPAPTGQRRLARREVAEGEVASSV